MLSNLLAQTLVAQSTEAQAIAAVAALLQGNLLNTMASLGTAAMDRLSTQLVEDGYGSLLAR